MISLQHRFAFIHVPKTGGNSIQSILQQFSDDKIVASAAFQDGVERFDVVNPVYNITKHGTLAEYYNEVGSKVMNGLFKFATIRNPWDMMVSYYFSPHRSVEVWDPGEFKRLLSKVPALRHYICLPQSRWKALLCRPISALQSSGRVLDADIDFLMRFENLEDDFAAVCQKLGLPVSRLPHRNASRRQNYREYYDEECRELVRERFREEIEIGEYTFD